MMHAVAQTKKSLDAAVCQKQERYTIHPLATYFNLHLPRVLPGITNNNSPIDQNNVRVMQSQVKVLNALVVRHFLPTVRTFNVCPQCKLPTIRSGGGCAKTCFPGNQQMINRRLSFFHQGMYALTVTFSNQDIITPV